MLYLYLRSDVIGFTFFFSFSCRVYGSKRECFSLSGKVSEYQYVSGCSKGQTSYCQGFDSYFICVGLLLNGKLVFFVGNMVNVTQYATATCTGPPTSSVLVNSTSNCFGFSTFTSTAGYAAYSCGSNPVSFAPTPSPSPVPSLSPSPAPTSAPTIAPTGLFNRPLLTKI